jgi:osmoprotectant transport system permease protein
MPRGLFLEVVDPWINWDWLSTHIPHVLDALTEHVELTAVAIAVGIAISLPLGVVAHRNSALRLAVLGFFGAFYTIPSLALFALLIPFTHLTGTTAVIPLIGYNVLILVRNIVVGLDAVPRDVLDAADGMGYRSPARLIRVELPLALPATFAGLRVATVSTIGIVTITALIGMGGLGSLIDEGQIENFHTPVVVGAVLTVCLALVADLGIAGVQRLAIPWARPA